MRQGGMVQRSAVCDQQAHRWTGWSEQLEVEADGLDRVREECC